MSVAATGRPVVFLDRDGTIIVEKNYLSDPDQIVFEAGAVEGLRAMVALGYGLVVVTNQSGVGRGHMRVEDAQSVNRRMVKMLAVENVPILGLYMCPHAPDENCDCRKPKPALFLQAIKDLGIDPQKSYWIGDKRADIDIAMAPPAHRLLLATGHGRDYLDWAKAGGVMAFASLEDASIALI